MRLLIDRQVGKITKRELMEMCPDISKITIERALAELVKNGYIKKTGMGKSTAYYKA